MVKLVNNVVIIGTCAFTAYLLLVNLPWYLPQLGDGESVVPAFYLIVFLSIALAVYSSSKVKYIRILSVGSSVLFITLIAGMWFRAFVMGKGSPADFFGTAACSVSTLPTSITLSCPSTTTTSFICSGGLPGAS